MNINQNICESCRIKPVEVLEQPDEGLQPYRLCASCHYRLVNYALRPLEFFHLAAIHGLGYFLHDDMYDYHTGEAEQPNIDVEEAEKYPFPRLEAIQEELEKVVDYACVQYFTSKEVLGLLKGFEKQAVLDYLRFKVEYNRAINYKAYDLAAKILGSFAADWIRLQWRVRKDNELLMFAPALAACLPFDEGFEIVVAEVQQSDSKAFTDNSLALHYFQSSLTLKWIETVKDRIVNVSDSWGRLAAASQFDWPTAQRWLEAGRPLSLIALDALIYCTTTGQRQNQPFWFREHMPTLLNAATPDVVATVVTTYLEKDDVPRTKGAVRTIINNLFETTID